MNMTPSIFLLHPLDSGRILTETKHTFIVVHQNSDYFRISKMKYETIIGLPLAKVLLFSRQKSYFSLFLFDAPPCRPRYDFLRTQKNIASCCEIRRRRNELVFFVSVPCFSSLQNFYMQYQLY